MTLDPITWRDRASRFRAMHGSTPLVLPTVWDPSSARASVHGGATALTTSSAAIAWARGDRDGTLSRETALAVHARILDTVEVPVSIDLEDGYGTTPGEVAETVAAAVALGAVGVNIEDGLDPAGRLRDPSDQAMRLRAARDAAGPTLYLNARTDLFLAPRHSADDPLRGALDRATAYAGAGADGLFVPGLTDLRLLGLLCARSDLPINVMIGPGSPSVAQLGDVGVQRASLGPALAVRAYAAVGRAVTDVLGDADHRLPADVLDVGWLDGASA
ncbi:MAG: isocitrate lyase/phosphoenolpyruvate mutase family protein [Nitriliruptoraceae bacterium]|nr:isocitrate lyase/phosphoenolpyruvate mutase family protein [Nitriliruptoraceae bacterium]